MTYALNWNNQTFGTFYNQVGSQSGLFEIILFAEFMIITLIGTIANKKTTGFSNFLEWSLLASFVTLLSATFLSIGGFIPVSTVVICLTLTVLFAIVSFTVNSARGNSMV